MPDQQLPADWPAGVHPPGSESFERTAAGWLFEHLPADYRTHGVLSRYPVALSRLAREYVAGSLEGTRQGYRNARVDLRGVLPPQAIDQVMRAYQEEGRRMALALRAIEVVDDALRAVAERRAPQS
ncbi:hypothetical protein [Halostreptopolyspora alba]